MNKLLLIPVLVLCSLTMQRGDTFAGNNEADAYAVYSFEEQTVIGAAHELAVIPADTCSSISLSAGNVHGGTGVHVIKRNVISSHNQFVKSGKMIDCSLFKSRFKSVHDLCSFPDCSWYQLIMDGTLII